MQPAFLMLPLWVDNEIADFEYRYVNEEFERTIGYSKEQMIGTRISNSPLLNDELRARFLQQLKEVFITGNKIQDKLYNPVLDTYFNFTRTKFRDGVLTVMQDKSQEYKMIRQLENQQNLLNNILHNTSTGITVTLKC